MLTEFPHKSPEGYSYEFERFNNRVIAIWLRHSYAYGFSDGRSVRSIWGFYSPKKQVYYAPVNSKTVGKEVSISQTSPYSAMEAKASPLDKFFC